MGKGSKGKGSKDQTYTMDYVVKTFEKFIKPYISTGGKVDFLKLEKVFRQCDDTFIQFKKASLATIAKKQFALQWKGAIEEIKQAYEEVSLKAGKIDENSGSETDDFGQENKSLIAK